MPKLSEEYFDLVRQAVREDKQAPKRKKRRLPRYESKAVPEEAKIVINLDSDSSDKEKDNRQIAEDSQDNFSQDDDEDYDSDDFEDISDLENSEQPANEDVSVTLDAKLADSRPKSKSKNMISNDERKFRKFYHMFHLLTFMVHGSVRNKWLNDPKLHAKLSKLVPDSVFELLHPKKDDELPLRSTRKLLDGLKKCMEIWQKHFKQITRVETRGLYMIDWDELDGPWEQPARYMSQKLFNKKVTHGRGSLEVASQGFVAMLRACGVNARLVFNAQPPDFTNNRASNPQGAKAPNEYLADPGAKSLPRRRKKPVSKKKDEDTERYSIFWCEVWDKISKKWITVDPMGQRIIEQIRHHTALEPRGKARQSNIFRYVIAYDRKEGCRDVTRRYTTHFNSKTRKRRVTKYPEGEEWFQKVLRRLQGRKRTRTDDMEDMYFKQRDENEGIPDNMQDLKGHPHYVLENDVKWNEVLKANCKECGFIRTKNNSASLKVYHRKDLLVLKTARSWYTEGRILKPGAKALKITKSREFRTGEATEERLYPFDETDLFVAQPLGPNDEVPTNVYGNIDIYVSSMIPAGACLIESHVAVKAASFLRIEFAKAVTGFKFEKKRVAKPQITGIVTAQRYREAVEAMIDGIEYANEEDKRQECELESLRHWNLLLAKLRIKQRLITDHGLVRDARMNSAWGGSDAVNVADDAGETSVLDDANDDDSDMGFEAGGFVPDASGFVPETAARESDAESAGMQAGGFELEAENSENSYQDSTLSEPAQSSSAKEADDQLEDYEAFMKDLEKEESQAESSTHTDSDFNYESE
ncbi:LAME_0G09626g1_1 [Lachancea meyersii CBS 8951]|uniref:LAME_0G09626g1_1 n=1 Tax=Lachancea meyersii CBS 8951 TaxID=1266667 RepID=A0A1G4K8Q8_9SACH|nr:LAME_0G09626g1_1 [Lachancea meyersii CBS 8951]